MMKQVLVGKVSPPTLASGDPRGGYVTTWDGKAKLGLGPGGVKYNVKVGDPCLGWPHTEYLEPGVALIGFEEGSTSGPYTASGTGIAFVKLSCLGNKVTMINGDAKGAKGVVTGKGGMGGTSMHLQVWFPYDTLDKICTGDKVKVVSEGVGLEISGWEGRIFNLAPSLFEALNSTLTKDILGLPVTKIIPIKAMGYGVGQGSGETGTWCIQSNPPSLVDEIGISDLCFGDIVALTDALIDYGKGYYKGAVTIGVITTGGSDQAGQGPGVMAIATSLKGKIKPRLDKNANIAKLLKLEA